MVSISKHLRLASTEIFLRLLVNCKNTAFSIHSTKQLTGQAEFI